MKAAALFAVLLLANPAAAQDTLRLGPLQDEAIERDPRARQYMLLERATELRLRNLSVERLPTLTVGGQSSYQSEVPVIPIEQAGFEVPEAPKDRYEARLDVEQSVYDGGSVGRRRAVEEARLRTEQARIDAALYPLRSEVNQAFFQVLLLQERIAEVSGLIEDLEARLALVRARIVEGAALPGDSAVVRAEMLRAIQARSEAESERREALAILGRLTGRTLSAASVLEVPELEAEVGEVRPPPGADIADRTVPHAHPRYALFQAQREELDRQSAVLGAARLPDVSGFAQWGYGRPGYEQFTSEPHDYWMAGLRVRWQPWNWGTTGRDAEILRLQRELVDTEEAAFTEQLERQVQDALESMERLRAALAIDEEIVALREQVERQASAQLAEMAITPAEYIEARTDVEDARLALLRHRVELARARAQYLTSLGVDLP